VQDHHRRERTFAVGLEQGGGQALVAERDLFGGRLSRQQAGDERERPRDAS